jgi:C1A family cysteine protease
MIETFNCVGWMPDIPDMRDLGVHDSMLPQSNDTFATPKENFTSGFVDLRKWFSPIENQGALGSCTAQAGIALIEFMERKFSKKHVEGSRLFLYKNTRRLAGLRGDSGAYLRDTIKAMVMFGVSEERYLPYDISKFDNEPDAFNYAMASNYKTLKYFRVDGLNVNTTDILNSIKWRLSNSIPLMFGTTVYQGIYNVNADSPEIPAPVAGERPIGGHAMVFCGFSESRQALLVRNSWGEGWGVGGYGWLPYSYVLNGLAIDIWGITKQSWVDGSFFN